MHYEDRYDADAPSPLIGLEFEDAQDDFPGNPIRIVKDEHGWVSVSQDMLPGRINVEVKNRRIVRIISIG